MSKNEESGGKRRGRRLPRWWMWILILAPVAGIVWLRTGDRMGDDGMTNFFSAVGALLTLLILLIWFMFARGYRLRTRFLTLLGLCAAAVAFRWMFDVVAFTGGIVPIFESRFAAKDPPLAIVTAAPGAAAAIDLSVTSDHDFPGFLGPGRMMHVADVGLARDWSARAPVELWRQPIGAGWSAFAVVNGVAVTQEERDDRQMVSAYDAETGALLWTHDWPGAYDHPLGGPGPRATPTIDDGLVYAVGPRGRLACLDGASGELVWEADLLALLGITPEADARAVGYGRANSPLVHGDLLIVPGGGPPGGLVNLIAFDKKTGARGWSGSPHQISYSSPNVAVLAGVEQIVIVNEDTVTGHDAATGRLLWEHPWPGRSGAEATSSQAVPVPPASVLVSKGYGVGSALLDLEPSGDGTFNVRERWHHRRSLRTKHTNVLVHGGHAYALSEGILECVELASGRRVWKDGRYGHGQILGVGDLIIVLSEEGAVTLVEATPNEPNRVLGAIEAIEGLTWNNIALAGDLLLVRNGREAAAYRLERRG